MTVPGASVVPHSFVVWYIGSGLYCLRIFPLRHSTAVM
jgi:hypothetical protein